MTYTGYTYEEIMDNSIKRSGWDHLLENNDILVDGRFDLGKRSLLLKFKGSENQRVIDVKQTRYIGKIVLADI